MLKKLLAFFVIAMIAAFCGACRNRYYSPTYKSSDSYKDVFEGQYVPSDVR